MKIKKYTQESLIFNIFEARKELEKKLARDFQPFNINYIQFLILSSIYLEDKKSLSPKEVSTALQISKSQLSQYISYLENLGLMKRSLDAKDARKVAIILTAVGKDLTRKAMKSLQKREKNVESLLNKSDLSKVLNFLGNL
jgi:DNA-binding MarR family transcriptional regulator